MDTVSIGLLLLLLITPLAVAAVRMTVGADQRKREREELHKRVRRKAGKHANSDGHWKNFLRTQKEEAETRLRPVSAKAKKDQ